MKKLISAFFDKQFLKFLLVGVANTLVGSAVMFGLYNLAGSSYRLSTVMNYVVGSVLSYFLNKKYTFKSTETSLPQILRFVANIAVCYYIAYELAKPLAIKLLENSSQSLQDNLAMLVGMVIFTGLNYLGQRFFAFKKTDKPENEGKSENTP